MNILIIGNSAAGTAAIEAIRHQDKRCSVVQLSDEAQPLYSRCLLAYYLSNATDEKGLLFRDPDFHEKMNVALHAGPGFRAVGLDREQRAVLCDNGQRFVYDRLLIATGSSAKLPKHVPAHMGGVFMLRNLADARAIKAKLPSVKRAVVLGGGLIGIKAATALAGLGIKTSIVVRSNLILSQMIDFDASRIITRLLEEKGIEVMYQTQALEVLTRHGNVTGVETDTNGRLECELLIGAKGVQPNTQLLEGTGLDVPWGIRTDAYLTTSDPTIFAAGDVAETFDLTLETHTVNALWTCAVQQGRAAGLNMVGKQTVYDGTIGMNSLNVYDTSIISFGVSSPKDESLYRMEILNQPELGVYKKIVIGHDNRIKGIILVGHMENAGVLLSLIRKKTDVSSFQDQLVSDGFNFGTILKHSDPEEMERYLNRRLV